MIRLTPYCFTLRLYATYRTEHCHRAIKHAKATFDFDREVNVSRGIDNINSVMAVAIPITNRRSARNRNTALLLLRHPVHRRRAVVYFTYAVGTAGKIQYALRRRRLACIDVRHNTDITHTCQLYISCHFTLSHFVRSLAYQSCQSRFSSK